MAREQQRTIATMDKDFGALAFMAGLTADAGVVLFRNAIAAPTEGRAGARRTGRCSAVLCHDVGVPVRIEGKAGKWKWRRTARIRSLLCQLHHGRISPVRPVDACCIDRDTLRRRLAGCKDDRHTTGQRNLHNGAARVVRPIDV